MAKTGIDVLYDIIQKKKGKYATAKYASDNVNSGLTDIELVDVDAVTDKLRLCRSLYSKTLYGLMGIQSLIPSLGKDTLFDVDTVLRSLNVEGLTVTDGGVTKSVQTYLRENGFGIGENPWNQMLMSNNVSKNADLGHSTHFVKDGKNCVRVDISDRTKKLSTAVAKVLAENSGLSLNLVSQGIGFNLDSINEYISTELPQFMEEWLKSLFPYLESAHWTFPEGLAQTIIDYHMEYVHVGIALLTAKGGYNESTRGRYWYPYVYFSQKEITGEPERYNDGTLRSSHLRFTTANSQSSRYIEVYKGLSGVYRNLLCFEEGTTNPVFDYTDSFVSEETQTFNGSEGFCLYNEAGELSGWDIGKFGAEHGVVMLNNKSDSGYTLIIDDVVYPTNNYTNAQFLFRKALKDNGLIQKDLTPTLGPARFDSNVNAGLKYFSLYCLVSSDGKWGMTIPIMTSKNIASFSGNVQEFDSTQDRFVFSLALTESGRASMYRDATFFPAGSAFEVNSPLDTSTRAVDWFIIPRAWSYQTGYSEGASWTDISMGINRSGDVASPDFASPIGNAWPEGTFVGATLVELFKNVDVTDWVAPVVDPAYNRIDTSLAADTFNVRGYIVFTEDNVDAIMNDELTVSELADEVNVTPVDDTNSLIDGTTPIGTVDTDINTENTNNGSLEPVVVPRRVIADTNPAFFSTLYDINALQLMNIADVVSDDSWYNHGISALTGNPVEGIFSLMAVPFRPPVVSNTNDAVVQVYKRPLEYNNGSSTVAVHANVINNYKAIVNMGSVNISEWNLTNTFRDYSPYTQAKIYLPFVGEVDLDLGTILSDNYNEAKLSLTYTVELFTGTATIELKLTNDALLDKTIYQTTAVVGMMLPVSGGSFGSVLAAIIGMAAGSAGKAIGGAIGSGVGGPAAGVAGSRIGEGIGDTIATGANILGKSTATRVSSASANAGFTSNLAPYITITTHNPAEVYGSEEFNHCVGHVANIVGQINSYDPNTYLKISSFDLTGLNLTREEQEALSDILREGFWT